MKSTTQIDSVDEYIGNHPKNVQTMLQQLRQTIQKAAPKAEEIISYQMPAYKQEGMVVYFAGHKDHIGFYPTPSGIEAFKKELSMYKSAKGSVQFPLDQALPLALIAKMVKFKVRENLEKSVLKKKR